MRKPLGRTGLGLLLSKKTWSETLSRLTNAKSRQFPRLRISPTRILALRIRSRNEQLKAKYRGPFKFAVNLRSGRLPVLAFQAWLARQDLSSENHLATPLTRISQAEWKDVFDDLVGRGWSKEQLDHWIWIISAKDGDSRIQRLVSTDQPQPVFLLLLLLRNDETCRKAESLSDIIRYTSKHHIVQRPPDVPATYSAADRKRILTVSQFLIFMRRLIYHVQRINPRSIVGVAHFIAHYIQSIPNDPHHRSHRIDYRDQCRVYNTALFCLRRPAANQPMVNREFNWRAQKVLLAMSDGLSKSLVINQASYRAIREVLVGLRKTAEEKAVALRYTRSWPPYRQDFDGQDTKRTPEDDRSRSVKAGVLTIEAGYQKEEYDRALDALGGAGEDAPTIQTRSLSPKQWTGDKEDMNIYSNWAMNIRATRNSQEAWRAFNKFAEKTELEPNLQVYSEMFLKLYANPVDPDSTSDVLPGDSREAYPVHEGNYSQYELARLSPPSVSELYTEMLNRGIRPRGHGLHILVARAQSIEEGLRYLEDSGMPEDVIRSIGVLKQPSYSILQKMPLLCFNSYVKLLTRLQPNRQGDDQFSSYDLLPIRHAIKLVSIRLTPDRTEGATFRPPWYALLRALARPHIVVQNGPAAENDLEALSMFIDIFRSAHDCVGIDAEIFIQLCRAIQKAALSKLRSLSGMEPVDAPLLPHAPGLLSLLTTAFSQLTTPIVEDMPTSLPVSQYQFPLGPPHLHAYMRTLGFLDAKNEMVRLVSWMMDNYEHIDQEASHLNSRGPAMVAKTLCAFRALVGPTLSEGVHQELVNRMNRLVENGGHWRWPTSEEVGNYIGTDPCRATHTLQRRIMARARQDSWRDQNTQAEEAAV